MSEPKNMPQKICANCDYFDSSNRLSTGGHASLCQKLKTYKQFTETCDNYKLSRYSKFKEQ